MLSHELLQHGEASKASKLKSFSPDKPETFDSWYTQIKTAADSDAYLAIDMGSAPTLEQARAICGPLAADDEVEATYHSAMLYYTRASHAVYRLVMLNIDFNSGAGQTLDQLW